MSASAGPCGQPIRHRHFRAPHALQSIGARRLATQAEVDKRAGRDVHGFRDFLLRLQQAELCEVLAVAWQ